MIKLLSFRRAKKWKLRPHPIMRDLTVGVAEAVCASLDIEVDLLLNGELIPEDLEAPPLASAHKFLDALLENGNQYDIRSWPAGYYEPIMAGLMANFMAGLFLSWRGVALSSSP